MRYIANPTLKAVLILLIVLFSINGAALGAHAIPPDKIMIAERVAYFLGYFFSSFLKGVLISGAIWVIAFTANKFRLRKPDPAAKLIGTLLFWVAIIGAVYCSLAALFLLIAALATSASAYAATPAITMTTIAAVIVWATGCGIRHFLIPAPTG